MKTISPGAYFSEFYGISKLEFFVSINLIAITLSLDKKKATHSVGNMLKVEKYELENFFLLWVMITLKL